MENLETQKSERLPLRRQEKERPESLDGGAERSMKEEKDESARFEREFPQYPPMGMGGRDGIKTASEPNGSDADQEILERRQPNSTPIHALPEDSIPEEPQ